MNNSSPLLFLSSPVKRQNLKVQINATDDTICMKYLRLSPDTKLQGFILGYGSSGFSNQYIPLPSEGKSYVTEVDAEPRYLITVRPAPIPNHKKTCSGKTKTQKPLRLVVGTLTPTSVYLSWGILVNPQHDWTAMSSCASDRFYTVRYREKDKNKNWGFQLCPTTETVVENLKPNTPYEFGVKDNTEDGIWSKIFNHKTILFSKAGAPAASAAPLLCPHQPCPHSLQPALHPVPTASPCQTPCPVSSQPLPHTSVALLKASQPHTQPCPHQSCTPCPPCPHPSPHPLPCLQPIPVAPPCLKPASSALLCLQPSQPLLHPPAALPEASPPHTPLSPASLAPLALPTARPYLQSAPALPPTSLMSAAALQFPHLLQRGGQGAAGTHTCTPAGILSCNIYTVATAPGRRHPPLAPAKPTQVRRKPLPPNTVTGKPGSAGISAFSYSVLMLLVNFIVTVSSSVNTTVFSSNPTSETDSLGKQRFTGPHVKYIPKNDSEPCSITRTLKYFQEQKVREQENVTSPPQNPPSNLTVVTVEGCPSFVILNWTKPENDTVTYYVVLSTVNGTSNGTEKITITTKQTHCIVENLEPNRSYDFQVKARNPLGEGPSTPKVPFSTESADPRVSESISMGKDAIWTEVPFNSDSYSECKGKQYVKRTWYKKFVGVQLCNSLRYKIYLSDSLTGQFYNIGDERGHGEDHCQFVDSFLDGRTGQQVFPDQLPTKDGFFRAVRQEPVKFGKIGGETHITYVHWYECGTSIPGKW
uniref:ABI family member 3 binding protein n=1 Tax=Gopherus evgoodei TaxID=1825980 RepID=A0A8C4Y0F7_9SAUR